MIRRGSRSGRIAAMILVSGCLWCCRVTRAAAQTATVTPTGDACNPSAPGCPVGTDCYCCCGAFRCLPPYAPCCAIPCVSPSPTPTPPRSTCIGDCNGDDAVGIDELLVGVHVALGDLPVGACPSLECNENQAVTASCITLAVDNALHDCAISGIGGPCDGFVMAPRTCAPGLVCQLPGVPDVGGICVPAPTPTSTPARTPVLHHGHMCCQCGDSVCTDFAWVEVERPCPAGCQTLTDAECEAPCHGGPQSGPATCVALTPCTADADCDDGNGCTVDHCTLDGCTHLCVCV